MTKVAMKTVAKGFLMVSVSGVITAVMLLGLVRFQIIVDFSETRAVDYAIDSVGSIGLLSLVTGFTALLLGFIADLNLHFRCVAAASFLLALAETVYSIAWLID